MGNNGMKNAPEGQTNPGGEYMEYQEITLGQVTYEISRVFAGDRPAADLVLDRLSQAVSEKPSFDVNTNHAV